MVCPGDSHLAKRVLAAQVYPFGDQIHAINDASANADPDANFRLIKLRSTEENDVIAMAGVYSFILGLNRLSIHDRLHTRGEVVLRNGSDGIVHIQSQKAREGTPKTEIVGVDICNAPVPAILSLISHLVHRGLTRMMLRLPRKQQGCSPAQPTILEPS